MRRSRFTNGGLTAAKVVRLERRNGGASAVNFRWSRLQISPMIHSALKLVDS
jgi:hypothetical protein